MSVEGRIAVVTGAARGIGQAIAVRLAEAGARVYCADLSAESLGETVEKCGGRGVALELDVSKREAVDAALDSIVSAEGRLDICVNNAGINRDAMLHKMTDEQWDQVIAVDLSAVFYVTRGAARIMRAQGSGRIVNVSSASWLGNLGQANYAAAKAGVVGLTLTAARELGRYQVTANAICPGFIDTDMTRALPSDIHAAQLEKISLGRAGEPRDVANLVAFLASDDASYITGEVINIGGGYRL